MNTTMFKIVPLRYKIGHMTTKYHIVARNNRRDVTSFSNYKHGDGTNQ